MLDDDRPETPEGGPTPEGFGRMLLDRLVAAGGPAEYRFEPDEGRILRLVDGELAGTVNLGNMFASYLAAAPEGRDDYFANCLRTILRLDRELPDEFDLARADLRPRIWPRAGLEHERLRGGKLDVDGLPSIPVGEHLLATIGYDWPESVQSVGRETLEGWGVSLYEAMEVSLANLAEATDSYGQIGEGLYVFCLGDSYDATRLLLVDLIGGLEVRGAHVALAARRDELLITGSDDPAGLEAMANLCEASRAGPYPLSVVPMVLEDGAWVDWLPPEGHPLRRRFADLRMNWLASEYADQKPLLEAIHQSRGVDLFVASILEVAPQGGEGVGTCCAWFRGIDSLLPEADEVLFLTGPKEIVARATWSRVLAEVGPLMEPTDDYPPRWRVRDFPDAEALGRLGPGGAAGRASSPP